MISTKLLFLAPIWGFGATMAALIGHSVGPDVEERVFPVFVDQVIEAKWRTEDFACWAVRYKKNRAVTLTRVFYVIEREDGIRYPVNEIRPDLGIPSNDSTTAKQGITRTIPRCVNIPPALKAVPKFTVLGHQYYSTTLWELDQPIVPIKIDFLPDQSPQPPAEFR